MGSSFVLVFKVLNRLVVGSLEPEGYKFVDFLLDAGCRAFTMLSAGGDARWFKGGSTGGNY